MPLKRRRWKAQNGIDGRNFDLNKDRIVALSKDQLVKGFKIRHNSDLPLSLNAALIGPRKNRTPIDNGYSMQKWWFDAQGNLLTDNCLQRNKVNYLRSLFKLKNLYLTEKETSL